MSRMNGYSPSRYTSGAFGSQMNGHGSQSPEQQGRAPASKSSAKALYEQRKNYTKNSINSITDTSQYHVEHLTTFVMDRKEAMMTIEDGIRKLKLLDAKGKVWTQDMLLQVDEKAVSLIDGETKSELENFPLAIIQHSQAVLGACRYDSILALVCKESGQGKPDMHLFQCDDIKANLIHADIESAISDHKGGKVKKRPETLRMILKSGGDGVIPPPPAAPAPVVPASAAPVDVKSRVAAWSAWTSNDQQDHERLYSRHGEPPEAVAAKIDRDVQILNHILDDIEYFVTKLQKAAEAFNELSKRKKTKKNKKKGPGEGVLTLRARPPQPDEFIDCFQKFKLAFNLLAKLRSFIQNPSALDLVHFLFTPLNMVVQTTGGVELAKSVVSPLLTREALEFLHSVTTAQEKQLWVSLGDGWIKCRAEWPKDRPVAPYSPCFRSGWQPPALAYGGHSRGTEFNQLGDSVAKADVPRQEEPEHSARSMMQDFPSADGYAFSNSAYKRKHLLDQDTAVAAFKQAVSRHVDRNYEAHGRTQPTNHAKSKFDFVARNSTELSVGKDEIVEVLDDRKQWWKVRNTTGASGYVPNNILEISRAVQMSAGQGGEPVYTHTFQQLLGELNEKQRPDSVPTASAAPTTQTPIPPPSYPAPVRLPSPPPPIATPTTTTTTTPVETRVPAASVSRQSSIACDNGSVTLREVQQKDRPPPVTRRKSNMEEVQDELLHRLTLGRSTQKKLQMPARSGSLSAVNISYDSPPEEVRVWLQIKGFSPFTINSLGMLTGAQLFSLSKDELKTVCPDDGARVYSQVTVQKGALERSSGSELQEIMRRRQEKLNATACDSGVESFDEAGSH